MTAVARTEVFDRVVCGVDPSDAGLVAARAAALVADQAGSLTLVTANDPSAAVHAGWSMSQILEQLAEEASEALEQGKQVVWPLREADAKLVKGAPLQALLAEIERADASLVVVGSHGLSRATGIALGSIATYLLHQAPCAVLIARGEIVPGHWPRRIVVGIDGSPDSARAYAAASALATRLGAELRPMVATQDAHVDVEAARAIAPDFEEHDARALDTLNVASETAGLVVVGSRGLRGLRALGSLSERLAHEARSSVLVLRSGD
jgi:nucleotide-binding universal stress UspA family protein